MTQRRDVKIVAVEAPALLSENENARLAGAFARISSEACSRGTPSPKVRKAWSSFFALDAQQPRTFDRLTYAETAEGEVVAYMALREKELSGRRILYLSLAMTCPEYVKSNTTVRCWLKALEPGYLERFRGGFFCARTVNAALYSVIYRITKKPFHFLGAGSSEQFKVYPRIISAEAIEAPPKHICQFATELVDSAAGNAHLDVSSFVVRNSLNAYGGLYPQYSFPSKDPVVTAFFDKHLNFDSQDSLLVLCAL